MAKAYLPLPRSPQTILLLLQPVILLLAVWMLLPKAQPTLWIDVPVIIISPDGSERVLWQGEDRLEIQHNIEGRMAELATILFSNPQDTDQVRQKISDGLKQFTQESPARQAYLGIASRALALASTTATSFVRDSSDIRYIEKEHKWDTELRGTWTWSESGTIKAQKLRLALTFRPAESLQKSKTKRALSISELKVAYED